MAYYGALISFQHTIRRLLNSSHISILFPTRGILQYAYKAVSDLQRVIRESEVNRGSKRINILGAQIREAVFIIEDALESHISASLGDEGSLSNLFSNDMEEVWDKIFSFAKKVREMQKEYRLENLMPEEEEEEDGVVKITSELCFDDGSKSSKMIGLSHEFSKIKDLLMEDWTSIVRFVSLVGMGGIGKTTLAMKVFEDPLVVKHFHIRISINIGPKYRSKEFMLRVLDRLNHDIVKLHMKDDEELTRIVYASLQGRRYLIVLDDLWSIENLEDIARLFPRNYNGSRVLLTTRHAKVAQYADMGIVIHMPFLDKDESWYLLRERVFGEGCSCPYQLEKAGKKIAENCEGLPLAIVTVAGLLSKAEKTLEYWNEAADKKNSVFTEAYDEMLKVLFPSYKYLPEHLKSFFLYIGVFPPGCKIPASKLIQLWKAEGFVVDDTFSGQWHLVELVSRSLVLVHKHSIRGDIKTCRVHSAFIHLCTREAGKDKFFHVINNYDNGFTEGMKSQRMLSIHNNVLFAIKNVYESMSSVSTARSLLCTGPHHQYPVPICFNLRFLRVLDALTIRFYKFPIEVLKLVHLRYFALTCSGKLPSSISKLRDLEYLIVSRHLSINKSSRDLSYLPIEIWEMQELKHLQLIGSNLPDPWRAFLPLDAFLPNLLTLLDVNARSCTKRVLERIPNLKKLGIQIELEPDDCEPKPLFCFDHLFLLHKLQSLKCVIVNPNLRFEIVAPPARISIFPSSLEKLTLSGFRYSWEDMKIIAELPNLKVLKLQCYAFRGPVWEIFSWEFLQLQYLLLEDTDLVHWRDYGYCFPSLQFLIIRNCYKLKEIPSSMRYNRTLHKIDLVDCPLAMSSIKQIESLQRQQRRRFGKELQVFIKCSWDDEKPKS